MRLGSICSTASRRGSLDSRQKNMPPLSRGHAREISFSSRMVGVSGSGLPGRLTHNTPRASVATTSTGGQTSETQEGHGAGSRDDGEAETGRGTADGSGARTDGQATDERTPSPTIAIGILHGDVIRASGKIDRSGDAAPMAARRVEREGGDGAARIPRADIGPRRGHRCNDCTTRTSSMDLPAVLTAPTVELVLKVYGRAGGRTCEGNGGETCC